MTARIEPARPLDALPSLALHREVLEEGRSFVSRPEELEPLEERERRIQRLADADDGCFLVARLPGVRVAGFVVVSAAPLLRLRHVGRVELMVGRAWRGQGLGRALLEAAIARSKASPVLRKLSLAVFADNAAAIALYRSVGFVEEGRRRAEVRMEDGAERDDLLMALALRG